MGFHMSSAPGIISIDREEAVMYPNARSAWNILRKVGVSSQRIYPIKGNMCRADAAFVQARFF